MAMRPPGGWRGPGNAPGVSPFPDWSGLLGMGTQDELARRAIALGILDVDSIRQLIEGNQSLVKPENSEVGRTNFVDTPELVSKWVGDKTGTGRIGSSGDPQWWDDYESTPGVEAWTDLRPTSVRRGKPKKATVPGAEAITQADVEGQMTAAREGTGKVQEPKDRADWLSLAKSQIGAPYVWADANPEGSVGGVGSGFDCSGFTAWLYSEAFGVALPHLSEAQRTSTQKVSRKNLRPGDLIFYHYSDRNGPGAADHVEIYLGNGKAIGTPSGDQGVGIQDVDWSAFMQGGRVAGVDTGFDAPKETEASRAGRERAKADGRDVWNDPTLIPASMGSRPNLADVQVGLLMDGRDEVGRRNGRNDTAPSFSGNGNIQQIKRQLYRGFMDAGRPDLAKMVNTRDFATWLSAESGWNPYSVSQYFPGHGRNAGLFQFMLGDREWVTKDVYHSEGAWTYNASPYEQARAVVQYFDLTPSDIKSYADSIRKGTYSGWG